MSQPIVIKLTQAKVNRAVRGLASQGWQQAKAQNRTSCTYYNPETKARCAVGWMLTARQALRLRNKGLYLLVSEGVIQSDDVEALRRLQLAHDQAKAPDDVRARIEAWCAEFGYTFNP
jgi:hypothetical protein